MGRYPWLSNSVLARNGRRVPCRRGVTKDQNPWEPRDSTACRQKTGFQSIILEPGTNVIRGHRRVEDTT